MKITQKQLAGLVKATVSDVTAHHGITRSELGTLNVFTSREVEVEFIATMKGLIASIREL